MKTTVKVIPQSDDSTNFSTADPVAQALRVAVGLPRCTAATARRIEAMAQPSRLFARGPKGQVKCETPHAVRDWIMNWDETGEGEPFDFEVEIGPVAEVSADYLIPGAHRFGKG
jgi:hypothetical protein